MWEGMFKVMRKLQGEPANRLVVLVSPNIWCFIFDKIDEFILAVPGFQKSP